MNQWVLIVVINRNMGKKLLTRSKYDSKKQPYHPKAHQTGLAGYDSWKLWPWTQSLLPQQLLTPFILLTCDLFFSYCFPLLQETARQQTVRMQSWGQLGIFLRSFLKTAARRQSSLALWAVCMRSQETRLVSLLNSWTKESALGNHSSAIPESRWRNSHLSLSHWVTLWCCELFF